jgi:Tfp pilus assembly protein PilN
MINLLPTYEKKKLRKEYRLRFWVLALFLVFMIFFIANVLLVPSLVLSSVKYSITQDKIQKLKESNAGKQKVQLEATVKQTNDQVRILSLKSANTIDLQTIVGAITKSAGGNIKLLGILYQQKDKGDVFDIEGIAKNRQDLIAYRDGLQNMKEFSSVVLPVSDLVADQNISFTMKITVVPSTKS